MKMKRILAAALAVGVLCVCAAFAASSGDSLISLSYLQNTLLPSIVEQGEKKASDMLQETYDKAVQDLDKAQSGTTSSGQTQSGQYSDVLAPTAWHEGDTVRLGTGDGFLLTEGSVSLAHTGSVVDITTGSEVPARGKLTAGHRYLVAEDTSATLTVKSGLAQLAVQGGYSSTLSGVTDNPFYDVEDSAWYHDNVVYAFRKGLVNGMDSTHYAPESQTTRAMMVAVLYRLAGSPKDVTGAAAFRDVPSNQWYYDCVRWASSVGIANGNGDGTFSPENRMTRQDAVTFLYRYATQVLGRPEVTQVALWDYQDPDKVDSWAGKPFTWAVEQKVITSASTEGLVLDPKGSCSRAQLAAMLQNFSEKIL